MLSLKIANCSVIKAQVTKGQSEDKMSSEITSKSEPGQMLFCQGIWKNLYSRLLEFMRNINWMEQDDPKNLKITSKDQETLTFHKQRQDLFIWQEPVDADTKQRPENTF